MGNFGNKILHNYQIGVVLRFFCNKCRAANPYTRIVMDQYGPGNNKGDFCIFQN